MAASFFGLFADRYTCIDFGAAAAGNLLTACAFYVRTAGHFPHPPGRRA